MSNPSLQIYLVLLSLGLYQLPKVLEHRALLRWPLWVCDLSRMLIDPISCCKTCLQIQCFHFFAKLWAHLTKYWLTEFLFGLVWVPSNHLRDEMTSARPLRLVFLSHGHSWALAGFYFFGRVHVGRMPRTWAHKFLAVVKKEFRLDLSGLGCAQWCEFVLGSPFCGVSQSLWLWWLRVGRREGSRYHVLFPQLVPVLAHLSITTEERKVQWRLLKMKPGVRCSRCWGWMWQKRVRVKWGCLALNFLASFSAFFPLDEPQCHLCWVLLGSSCPWKEVMWPGKGHIPADLFYLTHDALHPSMAWVTEVVPGLSEEVLSHLPESSSLDRR